MPTRKPNTSLNHLANISLLIYPVVAHIGVLFDLTIWSVCYLIIAIYINVVKYTTDYKLLSIILSLIACILLYSIKKSELFSIIIFLPPILIPCWLAFIFLRSLRLKVAVISAIAAHIEGEALDEQHLRYTRRLTALWGIMFLLMICEATGLAIWAPFEVWSWWVHIGNYIIVATLFLIEILLRHHFIGRHANFFQMLKALLQRNWQKQ